MLLKETLMHIGILNNLDRMKDIDYFLYEEDKYNEVHRNDFGVFDEEMKEFVFGQDDPLSFLIERPFHGIYEKAIDYIKENTKGFCLSEAEMTMLGVFYARWSAPFRDDYYSLPIPELALNMFEVLNSLVAKAPATENEVLYRFCVDEDRNDMKIGDTIVFPYNLTCTADKWDRKDNNIYVIHTLPKEETNAHDLYRMYSHGCEKQVNFLRGTKFLVVNKGIIDETAYLIFVMNEIK